MPIQRLNHAVLFVSDVERSIAFYRDTLGFRVITQARGAAFLQADGSTNDHDLGLFEVGAEAGPSRAGRGAVGLYHLAWEVDTLAELERLQVLLARGGALSGQSDHGTTKSLYGRDPDGLEFEVAWLVPAHALEGAALPEGTFTVALDLAAVQARYGADTLGGVGVSVRV